MLLNFELIKDIIICVFLLFGAAALTFAYYELERKENTIKIMRAQLTMLEDESKLKDEQFKKHAQLAADQVKSLENKTKNIMKEKVPHDCNQAVQWGIQQAKNFVD